MTPPFDPTGRLVGQDRVRETLGRALATGRLPHALLFHGQEGTGTTAAALELAAALVANPARPSDDRARRGLHPDVHLLIPHPTDAKDDDVAERLALLYADPYAVVDYARRPSLDKDASTNKQVFYSIARVHEDLHRPMSLRPVEGRAKVAVVLEADAMRQEAANAFLKLLEEPPPATFFVLTTSRPDRMLPTITSRCQKVRFDGLSPSEIADALARRGAASADAAHLIARVADGSFARALELAESDDVLATRDLAIDFFRNVYRSPLEALDTVDEVAALSREGVKAFLGITLRWMRDLLLYRSIGSDAPLVNVDRLDPIEKFVRNVPSANLEAMAQRVEEAIGLVERNAHVGMTLTVLAERLHHAMRRGADRPLYVPLTFP
jgi:DNA polymerase-3 subunit delta'